MIRTFVAANGTIRPAECPAHMLPAGTVWVDLFDPTVDEVSRVEASLSIDAPTREEMKEIEASARLYQEDGAIFMTALVVSKSGSATPEAGEVTFILARDTLVTLRYSEPQSFTLFPQRAERQGQVWGSAELVLAGLLEAVIDRTADILERVAGEIDTTSRRVFASTAQPLTTKDFHELLVALGRKNDLTSKARESLVSIGRMIAFLALVTDARSNKELRGHWKTIARDVGSLSDHTTYLANKITFLQDAVLGLINLEQNRIIRIMSVAATVILPPTLIGTIYGMNFEHMPELAWAGGYPMALMLMAVSAVVPLFYFRWRGWL